MSQAPTPAYERRMGATFRKLGTKPSEWDFTGTTKDLRDQGGKANGVCELCGKNPIGDGFEIRHRTKGITLILGSECIGNYVYADVSVSDAKRAVFEEGKKKVATRSKAVRIAMKQCGLSYEEAVKVVESREDLEVRTLAGMTVIGYVKNDGGRKVFAILSPHSARDAAAKVVL
jgi:hypothetical protein